VREGPTNEVYPGERYASTQRDGVVNLSQPNVGIGTVLATCQGMGSASADHCRYSATQVCPTPPNAEEQLQLRVDQTLPSPTLTIKAATTWNQLGHSAQGLWELDRLGPIQAYECSGTYAVAFTAL
jgi:hypothetical protein